MHFTPLVIMNSIHKLMLTRLGRTNVKDMFWHDKKARHVWAYRSIIIWTRLGFENLREKGQYMRSTYIQLFICVNYLYFLGKISHRFRKNSNRNYNFHALERASPIENDFDHKKYEMHSSNTLFFYVIKFK